jgi:hypothetical protein
VAGKLADADLDRIGGQKDHLIGVVQEQYGYTGDQAQQEVERRCTEYADTMSGPSRRGLSAANGAVAERTTKAPERGVTAARMTGGAATAVGETMGALARVIRDNAPHAGTIASAATAVAGGLGSARSSLHGQGYETIAIHLTAVMRRDPVHSCLVGGGLGYGLARMTQA